MTRRFRSRQSGVSAVEFGLVLPLMLIILLGIIDYGWVFFVRLNMTNAAREGARVGVTRDVATASAAAINAANSYLAGSGLSADVTADMPVVDSNTLVRVQVEVKNFQPLVGFVPTPDSMLVSAQMRLETPP